MASLVNRIPKRGGLLDLTRPGLVTSGLRKMFTEVPQEAVAVPFINVQGRKFLPGSASKKFPEYINTEHKEALTVLTTKEQELKDIGTEFGRYSVKNLDKYSCLLLKDTPIRNAEDFRMFCSGMDTSLVDKAGSAAFRKEVTDDIFTASDEPANYTIEPHNEHSYMSHYPHKVMFVCLQHAEEGGESPVVFNRELMQCLRKSTVDKFIEKKVRYSRNIPHRDNTKYISWQDVYGTTEREVAEEKMRGFGFDWEWTPSGGIRCWYVNDAVIKHPTTGETIWFNQIHTGHNSYYKEHPDNEGLEELPENSYHYHTQYGDGEEIPNEIIEEIREKTWKCAKAVKLHKGDVILLDNLLAQHSRMGFSGNLERKLLVKMYN